MKQFIVEGVNYTVEEEVYNLKQFGKLQGTLEGQKAENYVQHRHTSTQHSASMVAAMGLEISNVASRNWN